MGFTPKDNDKVKFGPLDKDLKNEEDFFYNLTLRVIEDDVTISLNSFDIGITTIPAEDERHNMIGIGGIGVLIKDFKLDEIEFLSD